MKSTRCLFCRRSLFASYKCNCKDQKLFNKYYSIKFIEFLLKIKIPYRLVLSSSTDDFMWNGKYLSIPNDFSSPDTLHEISHWVCASPKQREFKDFGMKGGESEKEVRLIENDINQFLIKETKKEMNH